MSTFLRLVPQAPTREELLAELAHYTAKYNEAYARSSTAQDFVDLSDAISNLRRVEMALSDLNKYERLHEMEIRRQAIGVRVEDIFALTQPSPLTPAS